jgi:ribosomal protein S18 acetylase RimI-like enzyme
VIVRSYEPRDRDRVLRLAERLQEGVAPWRDPTAFRAAVKEWVREAVDSDANEKRAVFVAEDGGEVVGFVTTSTRRHFAGDLEAYVGELVVDRGAEGRGVGRRLMTAAEEWGCREGLAHITLDTGAANARARAFYRALGYEEEDIQLTKLLPARERTAVGPRAGGKSVRSQSSATRGESAMPKQGDVHVVHRSDQGKWAVEVEGGRTRSTHGTKTEAEHAGREVAKRNKSELLIHRRDGKITARNTYGHDPRRSKG